MLLTISTTHQPATDLGFLLHKHPEKFQSFDLSFGHAHVFYSESSPKRCTACLLLDVDPVGMVRGRRGEQRFLLSQYVNDRPYVASSFLSVAIAQVLGTAMQGKCKDRPDLVGTPIPLTARLEVLPVRGGERFLHEIFEPLGYEVTAERHILDETYPAWGPSPYYSVTIGKTTTLAELLTHLYVLVPVFDNAKHYFVGQDELDKLVEKGQGWLNTHPLKELIARRFLKFQASLYREALSRLVEEESPEASDEDYDLVKPRAIGERQIGELPVAAGSGLHESERPISLNDQRLGTVLAALRSSGAKRVLDLGCGEGKLLRELLKDRQFEQIVGLDVSIRSLEVAKDRLRLERLAPLQAERIKLLHGSLIYRDQRLHGFDAAAVVEVIEHLDPSRLAALERVLFEFARPTTVVLTTPNAEYNVMWESLPAGTFRHSDHRFEWTRAEFQAWASKIGELFGYFCTFLPVGPVDQQVGSPTQMGVFHRV
jgi:3' terminal RNA ribose 2'-O-methyltransferase Hen1